MIRDVFRLKGIKEGCGQGEWDACTIVVEGKAVNACLTFAVQLEGKTVLTVKGLAGPEGLKQVARIGMTILI